MGSRDRMGLRTDVRLDLNYILLDAAALRDVTALQFVSTLWAAAVCSVSIIVSCPKRSSLPTSSVVEAWRLPLNCRA
ncbi:mCG1044704 [Mus musculus]|nr:mCG1044704 [Mus musculus]